MSSEKAVQTKRLPRVVPEHFVPHRVGHVARHEAEPRELRVMKFGGTSVGDALCIRRVAGIVSDHVCDSDLVVVVSAMSGVTNQLLDAASHAEAGNRDRVAEILRDLRTQHTTAIRELFSSEEVQAPILRRINHLLDKCAEWCESTAAAGELTLRARDSISSLGERLSAPLVAAALSAYHLTGEVVEATDIIVTDDSFGSASPNLDLTRERADRSLRPMLRKGIIPVVTGFLGATESGVLTTLGRGGSDYSATILATALKADEVVIWSDVDGMLTADPRLVPNATTIPEISYREASELAHFGAKVLHPKTLEPVMQDGIPVWVRNTFSPEKQGTKITAVGGANHEEVKALTSIRDAALIRIGGLGISAARDVLSRTQAAAKVARADVLMISKSPSRNHVFLVVGAAAAQSTVDALRREFFSDSVDEASMHVSADSSVSLVTIVGENRHAVKDIVERAIDELNRDRVSVLATGQNSSCHVSLVVAKKDLSTALFITHREFERGAATASGNIFYGERSMGPVQSRRHSTQDNESVSSRPAHREEKFSAAAKVLDEDTFRSMIAYERKRTERSRQPVVLMLLDVGEYLSTDKNGRVLGNVLSALSHSTRDTDVTGWYKNQSVVGVMFTETGMDNSGAIVGTVMHRVGETLRNSMTLENSRQINISLHIFPEDWNQENSAGNPTMYPDLEHREKSQRTVLTAKRVLDIAGSLAAILLFSPLFLLCAVLVKLSSKGPILFTQERIGQFGKPFNFLKFRSMYANNDPKIHQEFMKRVISGNHKKGSKMTNDPRITRVGRILRKSSLDELPQFFSVLKGDMSLVGPRPPLAYECQEYDIWHRRRVLEVKPGITGLWQVTGRSRLRFDEMVRLDLQYVRSWSLWLDLKILLKTPFAVIRGGDAF